MTKNRAALKSATENDWPAIPTAAYEEIGEISVTLVTKLEAASRGGETFTTCPLWDNSTMNLAIKQAQEKKHANELLAIKRRLKDEFQGANGDIKRSRRDEKRDAAKATQREPTEQDKDGDILVSVKYLACPKVPGDKQPCGAHHRQGVACARTLRGQTCKGDHTPIDNLPRESQQAWLDHVNANPEKYSFNTARVTVFKKAGDKWVWA